MDRPNVLLITVDQMRRLPAAGTPGVETPFGCHGPQGVMFTNAILLYQPVSFQAAIMTGSPEKSWQGRVRRQG